MGDQIYAIDGTVCRNMTTSDVKALITNSRVMKSHWKSYGKTGIRKSR